MPFVLPGLILGGIWAAAWLKGQAAQLGRTRATAIIIASCCAASLLIPTALTTLDLSVTKTNGVDAHGMAFRKIGTGEITAVGKLCRNIPPGASVVILDQLTADRFAQVVRGACNTPTAILSHPSALSTVVQAIEKARRRPVLLAENEMNSPGHRTSRRPADHAGGAQPDRAPDPNLDDPLHRLDEHAVTSPRGLVSSPVVSTFPAEPDRPILFNLPFSFEQAPHVTIVLPCYNEEDHVLLEVERICAAMDASGYTYELLAVDDCSTDQTLARLRRGRGQLPALKVIAFHRNGGAGTVRRIGTRRPGATSSSGPTPT